MTTWTPEQEARHAQNLADFDRSAAALEAVEQRIAAKKAGAVMVYKCPKCSGTGRTAHVKDNGRCWRCEGSGKLTRKAPTKRPTAQDQLDAFNARLAELYPGSVR